MKTGHLKIKTRVWPSGRYQVVILNRKMVQSAMWPAFGGGNKTEPVYPISATIRDLMLAGF